ncbi:hypothetical protein [Halorubrum cibi]|uniref:Uncharacterized protein n=1 Tax=Halorubrum cibi TaxID=413815 RepID=A0A521B8B8_9EURY|nr:hypothetical protein [Halorubrum cibi]SMO43295.1 hypothetical protein SAMN06264867_10280 [Halorubrum cibi]
MGLITTLRRWIGGLLGSEPEEPDDATDEETAESEPEEPEDDRLDPDAVTETRSTATDDAVDKLRSVREEAATEEATGDRESVDPALGDDDQTDSAGDGKR